MNTRQRAVLIATILGSSIAFLDGSIVNLALPKIAEGLGASFAQLQWIVDGYVLTMASLILLGGSLSDIFGRKKLFLIGVGGFGVASVLCGIANSTELLIGARLLQGVFSALLVPQSLAIIMSNFSGEAGSKAIGTWTAWSGISTAIAPLIGGYLLDISSWRWIFFLNVPLVLVCLWLGQRSIHEVPRPARTRRVDWGGALLAVVMLAGITYGLIEGPASHWNSASIVALATGIILMPLYLWFESHHKDPMLQLSLFRSRNFAGANMMTFAMYGALSGFVLTLSLYLQNTLGYSSIEAGLAMLPITIMMLLFSGKVGVLAHKYGPRIFMTVGPLITAVGIFSLLGVQPGDNYETTILPGIIGFSIGLALTVAPLTNTVMNAVSSDSSGIASAINNAMSRLGGLIVVALLGFFGAQHAYVVGIVLCTFAAALAGGISFVTIRNNGLRKQQ